MRTAVEIQRALRGRKFAGIELVTRIVTNTVPVIAGNVGSGDLTGPMLIGARSTTEN